jgi:hypothetical protein
MPVHDSIHKGQRMQSGQFIQRLVCRRPNLVRFCKSHGYSTVKNIKNYQNGIHNYVNNDCIYNY